MGKMHYCLGFDGDCATCTKMAHDLEALSAGRLTARNLRDPEVQGWRERAWSRRSLDTDLVPR